MRGNADAGVRKSTQEKVTKLQSAIDEILAKAAQQKTEQELSTRNATDSWYQQALQNLDTSARSSASTEYAAEQEAAAKIQAAQLKRRPPPWKRPRTTVPPAENTRRR